MTAEKKPKATPGDIKPLDNHATGGDVTTLGDNHATGGDLTTQDNHATGDEIK